MSDKRCEELQRSYDEYYSSSTKTVMVPVKIKVYDNFPEMVISFEQPTIDDIEKVLKGDK